MEQHLTLEDFNKLPFKVVNKDYLYTMNTFDGFVGIKGYPEDFPMVVSERGYSPIFRYILADVRVHAETDHTIVVTARYQGKKSVAKAPGADFYQGLETATKAALDGLRRKTRHPRPAAGAAQRNSHQSAHPQR